MSVHAEAVSTDNLGRRSHRITTMPFVEANSEDRKLLSDATLLRIANSLQSSLHVKDVIRTFAVEARRIVRNFELRYRNRAEGITIDGHSMEFHRCTYDLNLLGKSIGETTFSRAEPFTNDEQALLEVMLCALVYPLRNALMYERALHTALRDPLTGINNRASMDEHLEHQVLVAMRHSTPLSLLMIDVDKFKQVNDKYGHLVGDVVLTEIAERLVKCARNSDIVFRYGGEEFVIVLTNTDLEGATQLAERIRLTIAEREIKASELALPVTVSVGVTQLKAAETSLDLLERTDKQLYAAKAAGRNRVVAIASG